MHTPESILLDETHNILWDFEIPENKDVVMINKKKKKKKKKKGKRTFVIVDLPFQGINVWKIKEIKYFARELKS